MLSLSRLSEFREVIKLLPEFILVTVPLPVAQSWTTMSQLPLAFSMFPLEAILQLPPVLGHVQILVTVIDGSSSGVDRAVSHVSPGFIGPLGTGLVLGHDWSTPSFERSGFN